jgi:hypothetical protein
MGQEPSDAPRTFSLNDGGPFRTLMARLHLVRPSGMVQSLWLSLFAWLPLMIGGAVRIAAGRSPDPTLLDISVHARLLVSMPMLLFAERLVEIACGQTINSLYVGNFCDRSAIDRVVDSGERLRDAWWPEALLVVIAIVGQQLVLRGTDGSGGLVHGHTGPSASSFALVWYAAIALPLWLFITFRWLWHWLIWTYMLVRFARLPLRGLATHPDRAAGLACLSRPASAFGGFAFAMGAVLAGAWGTDILGHHTTLREQMPELIAFLFAMLALGFAPLLLFCGHVFRARRRTLPQYGDFANHYGWSFHEKWIEQRPASEQALGTSDIQSFADLINMFEAVQRTRWLVFGPRKVIDVLLPAVLPMVPLLASVLTFEEALRRIVSTVLGRLPH